MPTQKLGRQRITAGAPQDLGAARRGAILQPQPPPCEKLVSGVIAPASGTAGDPDGC